MLQNSAKTDPGLLEALAAAQKRVNAMSAKDRREMYRKQRESWVRAFEPCEHGMVDFEQCGDCRAAAQIR